MHHRIFFAEEFIAGTSQDPERFRIRIEEVPVRAPYFLTLTMSTRYL